MELPPDKPTPDWGTLGPGSDIKATSGLEVKVSPSNPSDPRPQRKASALAKIHFALLFITALSTAFFLRFKAADRHADQNPGSRPQSQRLDSSAQSEAELLLRQAIAHSGSATSEIESRAPSWHGRIHLTPQLSQLIAAGLNANDLRIRAATVQLDLAAMNVNEDASSVDRLASQSESTDHATRIWAIWTLGLLANRGLEQDRITSLLISHLGDSDVESRHWAVEALSYVATDATIPQLLRTLHDDPTPMVRERAACALAESGMFTKEQRSTAVPMLLTYAEDSSLDAQTHAWTYHALRDITVQNLPENPAAWRNWYENSH